MPLRTLSALAIASTLASGCNFDQAGIDPTPGALNFPIALELTQPDPTAPARQLVVVNSNFDLRFNSGSVQVYDLDGLDAEIAGCAQPGEDCVIEGDALDRLRIDEVGVGSHAAGLAFGSAGSRLYIPARREQDLTWIDYNDGGLGCGAARRDPESTDPDIERCDATHRVSRREAVASERALTLAGDPVAVAVLPSSDLGADVGDFIIVPLRDGRVALFLDDGSGPELIHVASGFPENIVTVTVEPGSGLAWMTAVGTNAISRVGVIVDEANPARSFLYDAGALRLGGVDDGQDTRDFQFHPSDPNTAFVLSRRPESVVEVDLERRGLTSVDLGLHEVYEVGRGPSRLTPIQIDGRTYVLASCFDAQRLFVIDVDNGTLVSVVGGLSGPFELAVDAVTERLFVVDFTVSVIRVIDLSPLHTGGDPTLIATLGKPNPPKSLID